MIELHVERTGHPSEVRRFSAATLTLGRAPDCDLTLDDPSVSRRHCRLARAVDGWSVEDLESANGTRIDDDPVTAPRLVPPGAVLTVGAFRITLAVPAPAARPTVRPRTTPAWLLTARRLTVTTLVVAATVVAGWTSARAWDVPLRLPEAPDGCPDDPAVASIEAAITSPPVDLEDAVQSALDAHTRAPTLPAACDLTTRTAAALTAALARIDHLRLGRHDVAVQALAAGPDGRVAAIDRDGRLTLWSAHHRGEPLTPPALPEDPDTALLSLARSPDGRWLAAGADDGRVVAWDLHTSLPITLPHDRKPVSAVQFSDDRHLWTLDSDGLLHLWTLGDVWTRTASTTAWPGVLTLTPARDGRVIAFGAGRAAVWTDPHRPPTPLTTGSALRTLAVAPGGADIIAGDLAGKVTRWRLARTLRPEPITAHGGPIRAVAVQAGLVASVGDDDALRLVDLDRRVRRNGGPHLVLLAEVPVPVDRLVITGDRLIGSGSEGALVTWDLSQRTRRLPAVIHDGHRGPVTALLATPTAAISGGSDGAVRLWPAALEFPADTSLHDRACTVLGWDPAPCDD